MAAAPWELADTEDSTLCVRGAGSLRKQLGSLCDLPRNRIDTFYLECEETFRLCLSLSEWDLRC